MVDRKAGGINTPEFTSLSCLMANAGAGRSSSDESAGLPDDEDFEQYVIQADVDRDLFAIALFEVKPIDIDDPRLLRQLGQTLLQFASPTAQIAYLGRNRFGLLSHTDDSTQRWVAPVTTALRSTLDTWWSETGRGQREDMAVDISDLTDKPAMMTGVARGLSRDVWLNAEHALARAYKQRIPLVEHQLADIGPTSTGHLPERKMAARGATSTTNPTKPNTAPSGSPLNDDRLLVLSRRIEPVDRPEPVWHWLRLMPGLRSNPGLHPDAIDMSTMPTDERALLEVWLASQVADLFVEASAQLRVSIPLSAEALRARSFAQRIFPLLERYRVPPSRLVVEIDASVITRADSVTLDSNPEASSPSVERFVSDAAAVNVDVAITGFDGGWATWHNLGELPVRYLMPSSEIMVHAGQGDDGAIRSLVLLAAEADERGIEIIAPQAQNGLSVHALAQIGFTYGEGDLAETDQTLSETADRTPSPVEI